MEFHTKTSSVMYVIPVDSGKAEGHCGAEELVLGEAP